MTIGGDGMPSLRLLRQNAAGDTSPMFANSIVYYTGVGVIHALDAAMGNELWHGAIGGIHWESPMIAHGIVCITMAAAI